MTWSSYELKSIRSLSHLISSHFVSIFSSHLCPFIPSNAIMCYHHGSGYSSRSGLTEFTQPWPLQTPQVTEQSSPCFLQVHLWLLQFVLQLHRIISNNASWARGATTKRMHKQNVWGFEHTSSPSADFVFLMFHTMRVFALCLGSGLKYKSLAFISPW